MAVPSRKLSRFIAQIAKDDEAVKAWLRAIPRSAGAKAQRTVYRGADAKAKWRALLVNHWKKLKGAGHSDKEAREGLAWLIETLGDPGLQRGIPDEMWSRLMLRIEGWDQQVLGRLHAIRKAMEADGKADEAADFFAWLLNRECGVNPKKDPTRIFPPGELQRMLCTENLLRHHPAFHDTPIDLAKVRRARADVDQLMKWKNADFELPPSAYSAEWDYPLGKAIKPDDYGRALENAQLDRMADENLLTLLPGYEFRHGKMGRLDGINLQARKGRQGDITIGKAYKDNFPHLDMLFEEGGTKFGQITHGDPPHLVNKYMRLVGGVDRSLVGAETQALENLRHMKFLSGTDEQCLLDMRRRCYLFVPENQVDGLRVLIAGHPNFGVVLEEIGLTAAEALDRIRPIARFP